MKAAVFREFGQPLQIETVPDPTPGPHEVVLKVGRCGVCSSDLHVTEAHSMVVAEKGAVLGHEIAGDVVAIGPKVEHLRLGDRVATQAVASCGECAQCKAGELRWCSKFVISSGGYAEYVKVAALGCVKLPGSLSYGDGALVEPLAVAHNGIRLAGMASDARVAILGAGPIGLATAYWARRCGAARIAVIATSHRREEMAMAHGATGFFINAPAVAGSTTMSVGATSERANDATSSQDLLTHLGGPPDVVFECAGVPGMIQKGIDLVKPQGAVIVPGLCTAAEDKIVPITAFIKEVRIQFAVLYSVEDYRRSIDALEAGHVEPRAMVGGEVTLDDLPAVFEAQRGRGAQCKVLVNPN